MDSEERSATGTARHEAGAHLRLADAQRIAEAFLAEEQSTGAALLDISIDSSLSLELARRRTIAFVDVKLPTEVAVHQGVRRYIKAHLLGRNAICFVEGGLLRTGFAVEDHSPETMGRVEIFANQLGELLRSDEVLAYPERLPGTPGERFTLEPTRRVGLKREVSPGTVDA